MIEDHEHLENGPYTIEWLQELFFYAQDIVILEIYLM